jgi:hypothetical protein
VSQAPQEIRDVIAGRPGAVNRFIRRFGKPVLDYATALIPDRSEPFDRMVEDIMVDAIAQARAAARHKEDEQVFEFVMEAALRTVRARYREVLDGEARPGKATTSYNFKEVLERTKMSETELTAGISEGRIRAVRDNDQLKIRGESIPGLGERQAWQAYHVTAAERELLCLHFRLHFSPDKIAAWSGSTAAQVEELIGKAANRMSEAIARRKARAGADPKDTEMRRYIDGRMEGDETAKFERSVLKDKIAQRRLDELRSQSDSIREMFDSAPYELSSISVNVRARNPHHALTLPPMAALWLQLVGIVGLMLMFHSVGGYIAPPDAQITAVAGDTGLPPTVARDGTEQPNLLKNGQNRPMRVGDWIATDENAQSLVVLDRSNRVLLAPGGKLHLLEPRPDARQVLLLESGEMWGRFASSGHSFAVRFGTPESPEGEIASDAGAEFDLVLHPGPHFLPDNLEAQLVRALQGLFEPADEGGLRAAREVHHFAGFRLGQLEGLAQGDVIESIDGITLERADDLGTIAAAMAPGETRGMTVNRDGRRMGLEIYRSDKQPWAVVRVFHGAIVAGAPDGERSLVNAGQWAVFLRDEPPAIGLRGLVDYRVLRIDRAGRFKQQLHWLHVESFPLRAENSVLQVESELHSLAANLERMRADTVQRSGVREILEFEGIMRAAIADARARIERGEAREGAGGSESLSDAALVAAEAEILSIIANWQRRSTAGIYPVLGSAAKTLTPDILRFEAELEAREAELTESLLRQDRIDELQQAIELKDSEIVKLTESEFHDPDGSRRAELDARLAELDQHVREGANARGRRDLVLVKLNDLDAKIDAQRRRLATAVTAVEEAQAALDETRALLAANIYTPEKLAAARERLKDAEAAAETAEKELTAAQNALDAAAKQATGAEDALKDVRKQATAAEEGREEASDTLAEAVTERAAAQAAVDKATKERNRIQAELDGMDEEAPGRQEKQAELDDAVKALEQAETALDTAAKQADAAADALKQAEADVATENAALKAAAEARDKAATARADAEAAREGAAARLDAARSQVKQVAAEVAELEEAKTARALLETRESEQQQTLETAQATRDEIEDRIEGLETQAGPEREKLATELALITRGEEAAETIKEVRRERGRHQAIHDDIELKSRDREALVSQRDQLAQSDLVRNYDLLRQEYVALSARRDVFKFVRARGLLEDSNFAHAQEAAQHAFKEAAKDAEARAIEILGDFCPAYDHDAYREVFADANGSELREAILGAMWKLYYDAGLHATDEGERVCYYVAVQSGADARTLETLDNRWRAYLTAALGNRGFESVARLESGHLGR